MTARVRQIRADEGPRLRALRLRALADSPWAFGSTLAREEAFTDDVWQERAALSAAGEDRVTFIAEDDDRWIGMATGLMEPGGRLDLSACSSTRPPAASAGAPRWSRLSRPGPGGGVRRAFISG